MSRCVFCGCTDLKACLEGCGWLIEPVKGVGLCSSEACQRGAILMLTAITSAVYQAKMPSRRRR